METIKTSTGLLINIIEGLRDSSDSYANKRNFKLEIPTNKNWINDMFGRTKWMKIGSFHLVQLWGCCGTVILTGVKIDEEFQGMGLGNIIIDYAVNKAIALGYSTVIVTVNNKTPKMHYLLQKNEFKVIDTFNNKKTNNTVTTYSLHI